MPLQAINKASAREKSIRHGHPSTLHLWWARRPLAACRAVLFSSLVNDPGDDPMYGIDEDTAATERAKLFDLIEDLVLWENSNNPEVINRARLEIARSIAANKVADLELSDNAQLVSAAPKLPEEQAKYLPDSPQEYTPNDVRFKMPGLTSEQVNHFLAHYAPPVLDPFAGGGSIPLEAQRLGLRAYASDLNPVPVLINKALIEIPPRFAGKAPVNPEAQKGKLATKVWNGAEGLAEDVRYYGKWMRDEAEKRIGHLYPKVKVTQEMVDDGRPDLEPYLGQELTVVAWIWCRTVASPNPACGNSHVPLVKSFWLCKVKGKEAYVKPTVDPRTNEIRFDVRAGRPPVDFDPTKGTVERSGGMCLISNGPIGFDYIREEGKNSKLGLRLMSVVAYGGKGRVYLPPVKEHVATAESATPENYPISPIPDKAISFNVNLYGIDHHYKLFTNRQLATLTVFSDLVMEAKERIRRDASEFPSEYVADYPKAVSVFLTFAFSNLLDDLVTLAVWRTTHGTGAMASAFGRQNMPMTWDFPEANAFGNSAGDLKHSLNAVTRCLDNLDFPSVVGSSIQHDATQSPAHDSIIICTDPPYYDNVNYADLSDHFYVWLRRTLSDDFPKLFSTLVTPKASELIATRFRHDGNKKKAEAFFESGLRDFFAWSAIKSNQDIPFALFYAFKQTEAKKTKSNSKEYASTGWETMLSSLIGAGFSIQATWPLRTERPTGLKASENVLATSIVLSCRPREADASMVTRRDFANALRKELPEAIKHLQSGNVAPVDLAQASIGPGMAVFSRYKGVVNADGSPMSVREALQLINQILDESLVEQESDFDAETRFAIRWFEQHGLEKGPYGDAEVLATAMAVSVKGVEEAGLGKSGSGKMRLFKREELPADWLPQTDSRLTMWESTQHLIRRLETEGETRTAELLVDLLEHKGSESAESARELSYRLYQTCERAKRADEARSYNGLVVAWPEIFRLAMQLKSDGKAKVQGELL